MNSLSRLFPQQFDHRYEGRTAALWLLGLLIALKLVMSVNSILNTESVAAGADGIPLDSYGAPAARQVLLLFAMVALGQLAIALTALLALVRYRAMVPFAFLLLTAEHVGRRLIVWANSAPAPASAVSPGFYINIGLLILLLLGLGLSLWPKGRRS